jgi:ethanolamine transporter EutH
MKISKSLIGITVFSVLLYLGLTFFMNPINDFLNYGLILLLIVVLCVLTISVIDQKFSAYKLIKENVNKEIQENSDMVKKNLLINERYHKIDI